MRGSVTVTTADPTRNLSPMFSSVSKSPAVVKFSPNMPQGNLISGNSCFQYSLVLGGVSVDCLAGSAMNGKIGLPITVEVERSQHDTAGHWLFENSRRYWVAVAHNEPR